MGGIVLHLIKTVRGDRARGSGGGRRRIERGMGLWISVGKKSWAFSLLSPLGWERVLPGINAVGGAGGEDGGTAN